MAKKEEKVEEAVEGAETPSKAEFKKIIKAYAKANPAKYELKKEALLARLKAL